MRSSADRLGVRPSRVGVRVVGLEGDVVDTDTLERLEAVPVAEEAAVDLAVVVAGRRLGDDVLDAAPGTVFAPHVVGPFEHVREPADLAFRVRELQVREADEHAGEEEVRERCHRVVERERRGNRNRCVAGGRGHRRRRTDVHAYDGGGFLAGDEEGVPFAAVDRGQTELRRDLAEAHRVHAARRVAANLGRRELGVPQRHDRERDQATAAVTAPLLDHPVVVRDHARVRELAVLRFEERLAAEPGERRERQRRVDPVHLHVLDAGLGFVAAWPHLVVGDRRHRHVVPVEADRRHVALVDVDEVLVHPAVGLRAVLVEGLLVAAAADVRHRPDAASLDMRTPSPEPLGQPPIPEMGGLDHVVIDADDLRNSCLRGLGGDHRRLGHRAPRVVPPRI